MVKIARLQIFMNGLGKKITDISDPVFLYHLQYGDMIMDGLRTIFFVIYMFLGNIVDYIETCFNEIAKIDFPSIVSLTDFENIISALVWIVLSIVVIFSAVMAVFKLNGSTEYIKWTLIAMFAIVSFGTYVDYVDDLTDVGLEVIDTTFTQNGDESQEKKTLSERIFYDNSYDMKASLANNRMTTINTKIPTYALKINERLSESDLDDKMVYDENGNMTTESLYDGWMNSGFMEERYYRFYVNFPCCIVILIICGLVYLLSMAKVAYIGWNLFYTNIYGKLIMATSVNNMNKISFIYSSVLQAMVSLLITSAGVKIFENVISSTLILDVNWLTKAVLLFVGGFITVLGSDVANKGLGLNEGTSFLLKSAMLSRMLGRGAKKIGNGIKKLGGNGSAQSDDLLTPPNIPNYDNNSQMPNSGNDVSGYIDNSDTGGYLGNDDFNEKPLFGGDDMYTQYHKPDIKDQWNEQLDKKVADKEQRYGKGKELQNEINDRFGNGNIDGDEHLQSNHKQQGIGTDKSKINMLKSDDLKKYGDVPYRDSEVGKHKSYAQYAKDYNNGDTSTLNPNYNKNGYGKKEPVNKSLPKWYDNQDITCIPNWENLSDEELEKEMANIDKYKSNEEDFDDSDLKNKMSKLQENLNQKILSKDDMLNEINNNPNVSESDRKYYNSLSERELEKEYNGSYKRSYKESMDRLSKMNVTDKESAQVFMNTMNDFSRDIYSNGNDDNLEYLADISINAYEEFLKNQGKGK